MLEILAVALWWLMSALLGALALPSVWRLFGKLPDRGYGFARVVGLLGAGYVYWLGTSLGFLRNGSGGALAGIFVLGAVGIWLGRGRWREMLAWIKGFRRTALAMELVFLLAFLAWAFVRANNAQITDTEKPMELAFLNSILRSDGFPPNDPWLSGFAISYYYFGYVLLAQLTTLTGVAAGVAFNLGNALWFALTALGSYSVLYNLLATFTRRESRLAPLLAPLFVLISGNLEGFLDVLWSNHVFWRVGADGNLHSTFWSWIDLKQLSLPPFGEPTLIPERHIWWWRASRVVRDVNLAGLDIEVIDEFPFFSFLLADNHPHLLALPFALLAVGFALQVFRGGHVDSLELARIRLPFQWGEFLFAGWLIGALAFLNTWDAGIYLLLLIGVIWWRVRARGWMDQLTSMAAAGLGLLLVGFLLFLPWYPTFASQASGVLPNFLFPTKPQHFLIMFAVSLTPLLVWLIGTARARWRAREWKPALAAGLGIPLALFLTSTAVTAIGYRVVSDQSGRLEGILRDLGAIEGDQVSEDMQGAVRRVMSASLARRSERALTLLLLGAVVGASVVILLREGEGKAQFISLLALLGALLILFPEFLYLKDLFNTRMNTVFKFYFAAWVVWGIAGAFAAVELWPKGGSVRELSKALVLVPLAMGLVYPVLSLVTKTSGFNPVHGRTLDGTSHLQASNPSDYEAIAWLNGNAGGDVLAEAARLGSSYSKYGRISAHTGIPAVIGWDFHQVQWRGSADAQGSRTTDMQILYETSDWIRAQELIERYDIDYVYVGRLERETYRPLNERKFEAFMDLVYENAEVKIYARRENSPR